MRQLAVACFEKADYPEALKYINSALNLKDDNRHLYDIKVKIIEDSGDNPGAIIA